MVFTRSTLNIQVLQQVERWSYQMNSFSAFTYPGSEKKVTDVKKKKLLRNPEGTDKWHRKTAPKSGSFMN